MPRTLADLVERALAKDPDQRPQSAGELLAALVVLAIPLTLWWMSTRRSPPSAGTAAPGEVSLAVLPIENIGGDSTTEYLADGMTGELAGAFKKVPGLEVVGDLSTNRFKGKHAEPAEIGRALHVDMLLIGKLQPGDGRIRLQMQLSGTASKLLWSNTYNRESKDNFALQDEITAAITNEMKAFDLPSFGIVLTLAKMGRRDEALREIHAMEYLEKAFTLKTFP